ncbi:MAG TPA: hypothetical protein VF162_17190 [Streptosporangiaceae bacterium]
MKKMRIVSLGGLAVAALAVGLPMLSAQAQTTVIPHGYGGPVKAEHQQTQSGHAMTMSADPLALQIAGQLAAAREATAKYAFNLAKAKADGYMIITKMMPNMGFHFLNPKISGFNVRKPQILVYEHTKTGWQLGALEWVFTKMPKSPPLPNATFGSFPAACHYADGTFIPQKSSTSCAKKAPSGAKFTFWHPDLITMHVWVWYPNPAGLFSSTNPLVAPFNRG